MNSYSIELVVLREDWIKVTMDEPVLVKEIVTRWIDNVPFM